MNPRVYDRVDNFSGGMASFPYAADLPRNQSQLLQNFIVLDNGRAVTRPGADWLDSNPTTRTRINPTGSVQGLYFLDNATFGQLLLMGQGGKLYAWNGATWSNALAFALTSASAQFAAVQGIDTMLISDGVQQMQLWNGSTFTACGAAADTNAPVGATSLAYIAGMFVAAGPAMVQGNNSTAYPADTLFFSNYLAGGPGQWNKTQSFRVGNGDGEAIIGLAVLQNTAAQYPIFNLAVLKENSIWIVGIQPGAGNFASLFAAFSATPQGDQVGTGIGCVGRQAFCLYQNDLLFMSQDGIQSLQRMQAAAGQYQLTSPLSLPIQNYIDRINWAFASNIKAVKYRQWAIFYVPLDGSTVNNYALVWDGRLGQWYIWTGWTPGAACVTRFPTGTTFTGGFSQAGIQLVMGNSDGSVTLWKDATNFQYLDSTYLDNGVSIPQTINTRSFTFGSLETYKKLRAALVRFNQGNATVSVSAYLDTAQDDQWNGTIAPGGAILPVVLPFVLATNKPTLVYRELEGLVYCNEMYLSITASSGWFDVRNVLTMAFTKPVRDPNA